MTIPTLTPAHVEAMRRIRSLWPYPHEVPMGWLDDVIAHLQASVGVDPRVYPIPARLEVDPDCGDCTD